MYSSRILIRSDFFISKFPSSVAIFKNLIETFDLVSDIQKEIISQTD